MTSLHAQAHKTTMRWHVGGFCVSVLMGLAGGLVLQADAGSLVATFPLGDAFRRLRREDGLVPDAGHRDGGVSAAERGDLLGAGAEQ
jgi:hypothetical protein